MGKTPAYSSEKTTASRFRGTGVRILLCTVILIVGLLGAYVLIKSAPKAKRRPPQKMMPLVQVQTVKPTSHRIVVAAMGTVIPAREMVLKTRVSGEVVAIHPEFTPGGFLPEKTEVLRIDDTDHVLAVARSESAVVNARYALKLELGYQTVAKKEWALLKNEKQPSEADAELALRKPHLEKVKAELAAAEADLRQAELDLARTRIQAPFNAMVRSTQVEVGSQVTSQGSLGELVGTDAYRVQASLPANRLNWIKIPRRNRNDGSPARIFYRDGARCTGKVFKLLGDLEPEGRMARILISVPDPLGLKSDKNGRPPLLLGEFVRVEIDGDLIEDVYRIPRTALRDNREIWLADKENMLEIRQVSPFWRDTDTVLLKKGLSPGERLILSELATPVAGMPLKIEKQKIEKQRPAE